MLDKKNTRLRRATRARAHIRTLGAFRLTVHKTPRHIYAQVIDDVKGVTLASASSLDAETKVAEAFVGHKSHPSNLLLQGETQKNRLLKPLFLSREGLHDILDGRVNEFDQG